MARDALFADLLGRLADQGGNSSGKEVRALRPIAIDTKATATISQP